MIMVLAYITDKVKAGECACKIKNPAGRCCLGEVNKTVKEVLRRYAAAGMDFINLKRRSVI